MSEASVPKRLLRTAYSGSSFFSVFTGIGKWILRETYAYGIPYVHSRRELPWILNRRGMTGKGAEIGVKEGKFSEIILNAWEGDTLYSVDPWKEFGNKYRDEANVAQKKQDERYRKTVDRLSAYGDQSEILRMTSEQAAEKFKDNALDFVYIDAQHHYEAVKQDIALWWPKVKAGGILAGHDYLDGTREQGEFGVKSAVDEFVEKYDLPLRVSNEPSWRSWFVFKNDVGEPAH